jgi:cytochrome P450
MELLKQHDALADRQKASFLLGTAKSDPDGLFAGYVDLGGLRFNPINPFVARLAVADYVLASGSDHATRIPQGALTLIATRSAMQDADAFPEPQTVQLNRPQYSYMHFGSGPHTCLGKYIGLMIVPATLKRLPLLPKLRRAAGDAGALQFNGGPFPESLTVAYG